MEELLIKTTCTCELIDVSGRVADIVRAAGVEEGLCHLYVPHTTAGVTVNENADPTVTSDFLTRLDKIVPMHDRYRHSEGNAAAHIKSILTGQSVSIPIVGGRLQLGRWQGIFLCEYDGPRNRQIFVAIVKTGAGGG